MPLFPFQAKRLAPVMWQIGRAATNQIDLHPGIILDLTTTQVTRANGNVDVVPAAYVAIQRTAQEANGGATYLTMARRGQPVPFEYLWPRSIATADGESLLIEGLDDFPTVEAVQNKLQEDAVAFVTSGGLAAYAASRQQADGLDVG